MEDVAMRAILRKASIRLIPFVCLLYLVNYIDRINISFAALTMNKSLGLTASTYGLGASVFFISYVLLEIPSSLALARIGARRWIARIMVSWGIVTVATSMVSGPASFFGARFLLGVAEAGFFPGILFYLTQWFPSAHRAKMVGLFMIGMPLSGLVGAPFSTFLLAKLEGVSGIAGWQWMFIIEGIPAVILGVACLWLLPDRPSEARWLEPEERKLLQGVLDSERREREAVRKYTVLQAMATPHVLLLAMTLFCISSGAYGTLFWIPQLIKEFGLSNMQVGWLTALPYLLSAIAMVAWSRYSDVTAERVKHVALTTFISAIGFLISAVWLQHPVLATTGLCIACVGIYATYPVFWTLPTAFLTGEAAAGAIALIVATGNLSGVVAPAVIGWLKDSTGGFSTGMAMLGGTLLLACATTLLAKYDTKRKTADFGRAEARP
jgi:ACS family tartrate transporter-like MFS transporter